MTKDAARLVEAMAAYAYQDTLLGDLLAKYPWHSLGEPFRDVYRSQMRAALKALEETGFRVVPLDPTKEMVTAGCPMASTPDRAVAARLWATMLDAAPKVTE